MIFLRVDISEFIVSILGELFYIFELAFDKMDSIIILNADLFGTDFDISFLDFCIGILTVSIIAGALVRLNKADDNYGNIVR